jgi:DNA invertase Pin-like site-specific DNA recombinase
VSVGEQIDTGSASGRLVLNMLTAVAQWEREAIGERRGKQWYQPAVWKLLAKHRVSAAA